MVDENETDKDELIACIVRWLGKGIQFEANHNEMFREARVELIYKGKGGKSPEVVIRLADGNELRMKISAFVADLKQSMVADAWGTRTNISHGTAQPVTKLIPGADPQD